MDPRFDRLLRQQIGVVSRRQLLAGGVSRRELDGFIERGALERVHQGVYRDPASRRTDDQARLAGVLAVGIGAVISHRAAAGHHGVRAFSSGLIELSRQGGRPCHRPGMIVHRVRSLPPHDVERLRAVRVTTPLRTVLDLPTVVTDHLVGRCIEQWAVERRLSLDELWVAVERRGGAPGAARLRALLDGRTLGRVVADSPAEGELGALLLERGLTPVHHLLVTVASGAVFELDWSFPTERVALELDGYGIHLRSFEAFDDDRWRRNELEISGWTVLNFTSAAVRRRADRVISQVRASLGRVG